MTGIFEKITIWSFANQKSAKSYNDFMFEIARLFFTTTTGS